jgi:hypothetical protein
MHYHWKVDTLTPLTCFNSSRHGLGHGEYIVLHATPKHASCNAINKGRLHCSTCKSCENCFPCFHISNVLLLSRFSQYHRAPIPATHTRPPERFRVSTGPTTITCTKVRWEYHTDEQQSSNSYNIDTCTSKCSRLHHINHASNQPIILPLATKHNIQLGTDCQWHWRMWM